MDGNTLLLLQRLICGVSTFGSSLEVDRGDPKKPIEFTIIDVCTCNEFEGLFFKYVELDKFSSHLKRSDDKICDYSTCKEILESEEYIFDSEEVFAFSVVSVQSKCVFFSFILLYCYPQIPARELSEYEQLREDNIKRNNEFLQELFADTPTTIAAIVPRSEITITTNVAPVEVFF